MQIVELYRVFHVVFFFFFDVCTFASLLKFSMAKDVKMVSQLFDQVRMERKSTAQRKGMRKKKTMHRTVKTCYLVNWVFNGKSSASMRCYVVVVVVTIQFCTYLFDWSKASQTEQHGNERANERTLYCYLLRKS